MGSRERDEERKRDWVTPISALIAAALWWFLSTSPSAIALILAAAFLAYLCLGYCLLALFLPDPEEQHRTSQFSPVPESQTNPRKALSA